MAQENSFTAKAISEWKAQIGEINVLHSEEALMRYGKSTLPDSVKPLAILKPATVQEIQSILKTASAYKIRLYPISRGKNWGYGDACSVSEQNVILELSRLNRIIEVNQELAYAVVEAGVSQGELHQYLKDHKIPLTMDATGAPPDASLVGNIMDRGYGQSSHSDHFLNSCGMEVVLANGEVVRTGFGHFAKSASTHLFKWGVGPYLDGIFTQSNFGIVTKIAVWLMPKHEEYGLFHFHLSNDQELAEAVERLRPLKLKGLLRDALHFFNDLRSISSVRQYPWKETGGALPLSAKMRKKIQASLRLKDWNSIGVLTRSKKYNQMIFAEIRKALKGLCHVSYVSKQQFEWAAHVPGLFKKIKGLDFDHAMAFTNLYLGVPTEKPSLLPYWRKRSAAPEKNYEPPRDNCGLIWCSPVIPMRRKETLELIKITRNLCEQYGFETNIAMNIISDRAIGGVIAILYDRDDERQIQNARQCHEQLLKQCADRGFIPYRLDTHSQKTFFPDDSFLKTCQKIKKALDPDNILAPGRYGLGN